MKEKMQTGLRGSPAQKPVFTASNNPACQNRTSYGMTVLSVFSLENRYIRYTGYAIFQVVVLE